MELGAACDDWSDPIPSGGDPYSILVPYWQVLVEAIAPIRHDAIVAREWVQVRGVLDMEPVPPVAATFVWNMRWRQVACLCWRVVQEHQERTGQHWLRKR